MVVEDRTVMTPYETPTSIFIHEFLSFPFLCTHPASCRIFRDPDASGCVCGGRRGKAAQGAAGGVGDVGVGHLVFLLFCLGVNTSLSLSLHNSPLLSFLGLQANKSCCCLYHAYYTPFFVPDVKQRFLSSSSIFMTLAALIGLSLVNHSSNTLNGFHCSPYPFFLSVYSHSMHTIGPCTKPLYIEC